MDSRTVVEQLLNAIASRWMQLCCV